MGWQADKHAVMRCLRECRKDADEYNDSCCCILHVPLAIRLVS